MPTLAAVLILATACSPREIPAQERPDATRSAAVAGSTERAAGGVLEPGLAEQVVIRRTSYGVPHIEAENLRAAAFAMGYIQVEDYGQRVVRGLVSARGELARHLGREELDSDFYNRRDYARAVETYPELDEDTRDVLEGFAAGVNRYVELHPDEFDDWVEPGFTGVDVHARSIGGPSLGNARRFVERLEEAREDDARTAANAPAQAQRLAAAAGGAQRAERGSGTSAPMANGWATLLESDLAVDDRHPDAGSNSWAFAPSRTESGDAILVRNPHLGWDAGYYEAHVTVPGVLDFYGDFRIGGPFGVIGGFNRHLGWSTTNNGPDLDEFYALEVDPDRPDHYLFEGASIPIERERITIEFKNGEGLGLETRTFLSTPLGPVFHRADGKIYVMRAAGDGDYRVGEQFLRMMRAESLEEWKDAMRMRAKVNSNLTYADADGNIFYVWNASIPDLPHVAGGDTAAVPAAGWDNVWTRYVPFDSLPQLLNPESGYLQNSNDSFHYTNLNEFLDADDFPPYFHGYELDLRTQLSLGLIANDRTLSLEDVVRLKHDMSMLLADRVKGDLVAAVRATEPTGAVAEAVGLIERWDNTVARDSRGGVLFKTWWRRYEDRVESAAEGGESDAGASSGSDAESPSPFAEPWTPDDPTATPRGLSDPDLAAEAFAWAVEETTEKHGAWDVAWGDVHRVRMGDVDVPVGGCTGGLGCFRVLWFDEADDGKQVARGGDGWVFAVEFGETPRAYTILAYGQSGREDSPHFDDQAEMFADNRMKPVAFTEGQIREATIREYRPGEEVEAAAQR